MLHCSGRKKGEEEEWELVGAGGELGGVFSSGNWRGGKPSSFWPCAIQPKRVRGGVRD